MFKEITEQELADMFGISLEQFNKECNEGLIKCFAKQDIDEELIDKFCSIPTVNPISANELRKILGDSNG